MVPAVLTPESKAILAEVDRVLKAHNICGFHKVKEINLFGKSVEVVKCNGGTPCCGGCSYLTKSGCSVVSAACKFWLCHTVRRSLPPLLSLYLLSLLEMYEQEMLWRYDGKRCGVYDKGCATYHLEAGEMQLRREEHYLSLVPMS